MYTLLLHEGAFARIDAQLKLRADKVRTVILHKDGEFRDVSGEIILDASTISLAYGTPDVWFSSLAQSFVKACLASDSLAWFQSSAAGLEHPVLQALRAKAGRYTSSHEQSDAIAEWVLWAGFDWLQKGKARRAAQTEKVWQRIEFTEIADTHWLIIGFGAIGQATGRRLKALGASVSGIRRNSGSHPFADQMFGPQDLYQVLGQADAVLMCLPHTADTDGIANADFFRAMRREALFANVGRGLLVDEDALLDALNTGEIDHATLDVTRIEPLPEESPIWSHPRITLTSHLAADTMGAARRTDQLFLRNLDRFLAGEPLENLVSKT